MGYITNITNQNGDKMKRLSQEPVKLYGHIFTKGDVVMYHKKGVEHQGIYIKHSSFSTWHNGVEYLNNRHSITIIDKDGNEEIVSWIKPVNPNQRRA
tara:strand:+ start:1368 stop:1658 length:291 start_codon:yes stop_codon:yes gene_type:complete